MASGDLTPKLADGLRLVRLSLGLEGQEVARRLGIGKSAYSHWEKGRTALRVEDVADLARAFDLPVTFLMGLLGVPGVELTRDDLAEWHRLVLERRAERLAGTRESHHPRPFPESANQSDGAPMTESEGGQKRHSRMLCAPILGHSAVLAGAAS